jgi:hypothetical protein
MAVEGADDLRLEFLDRMKRAEEMLGEGRLGEVDSLLLAARQLLNRRKAAMAAVLHLGSGLEEHQRKEIRQGSHVSL